MILDSSALVAIALDEPDRSDLLAKIDAADVIAVGAPTLVEAGIVLSARAGTDATHVITELVAATDAVVVELGPITGPKPWRPGGGSARDGIPRVSTSATASPMQRRGWPASRCSPSATTSRRRTSTSHRNAVAATIATFLAVEDLPSISVVSERVRRALPDADPRDPTVHPSATSVRLGVGSTAGPTALGDRATSCDAARRVGKVVHRVAPCASRLRPMSWRAS